jgi:hypothetical protein
MSRRTTTEIATKVKANVFVREVDRKTMTGEPTIQKVDGWGLGAESLAIKGTAEVVDDQAVARFSASGLRVVGISL